MRVRPAQEQDAGPIGEIFRASYGETYPYPQFFDEVWLKRSIFSDDVQMIVAEDEASGRVLGTASVVCEMGATSDLLGEFGRLAVHPDGRGKGLARMLMEARLDASRGRLHVAFMEARTVHPAAQKIARNHGFAPVGFLPLKHKLNGRESFAFMVQYFSDALELRRNNPRIIPEAYHLAGLALDSLKLPLDVVLDEGAAPYVADGAFACETLDESSAPILLRMERGRVRGREIFGPLRLQYGFFRLRARRAQYLVAREQGRVVAALGFIHDELEHNLRLFELIAPVHAAGRFLLEEVERRAREEWGVEMMEVDVSAHAPRMQRTFLELGFLPVAYVPAMVFDEVERLDVIRMVKIPGAFELGELVLADGVAPIAQSVISAARRRQVLPKIAAAVHELALFAGLSEEQVTRLASQCRVRRFAAGETLVAEGAEGDGMLLLLDGRCAIEKGATKVGELGRGETLGELSLLTGARRTASALALTEVEAAWLTADRLAELSRMRPDIAVILYRNLAGGLGSKLMRSSEALAELAQDRFDAL